MPGRMTNGNRVKTQLAPHRVIQPLHLIYARQKSLRWNAL